MTTSGAQIRLTPSLFTEKEQPFVTWGELSVSLFRFGSGVCGLRLQNDRGALVLLPFQGQQIWSARFAGRELAMISMFEEPRPTRAYLETYGAFLVHCGATAMGVPSAEDSHPLHGELPNAPYQAAHLLLGEDERGRFIALGGRYQHTVAFSHNYLFEPLVRLYAGATRFHLSFTLTNLKRSEMEYMYMAHINFRPVDGGRLIYSAPVSPESVRVRRSIPSHVRPGPGYEAFLEELSQQPEKHHLLSPSLLFDPEVVFSIDYLADRAGWAHTMQRHPDGSADYVGHRPDQLDKVLRWICRTADQDALGLAMPATAGPEGYLAERARGNLRLLPPGGRFHCDLEIGTLAPGEAESMQQQIQAILAGQGPA